MGVLLPEEYSGAGMCTEETVVMMDEIAVADGELRGARADHGETVITTEHDVQRDFRQSRLAGLGPTTLELLLNSASEKVLERPRSYHP